MLNLYERNGLMFWTPRQLRVRRMLANFFVSEITGALKSVNRAFDVFEVEAPLLTPKDHVNPQYTADDIYTTSDGLVLRPETTMGTYAYVRHALTSGDLRLPVCVWQHGKSFRREQDQPTKKVRLKEFSQLEFQIVYSASTKNDYSQTVVPAVSSMIASMIGPCRMEDSDRVPVYAAWTRDVVCLASEMEVCSISLRKDFLAGSVLEVAIGTDRCVYNFVAKG